MLRVLCLAVLLATAGVASADEAPIRIATEGAYPPFNYVDGTDPAGFEVDLGRALCAAMRATCTFVVQDWDGMIPALKEGRFDAIMSSMEVTTERRHRIGFSVPYYRIPGALIGPLPAEPAPSGAIPDLAGKSVGVVADTEFEAWLEERGGAVIPRPFAKLEEADLDLLTGRLDYVLGDKLALSNFLASREGAACCRFVADVPVQRGEGVAVGLRRDDVALKARFDAAIATVERDGTYDRIRAKYFPFDIK